MSSKADPIELTLSRREWLQSTLQLSLAGALSLTAAGCKKRDALLCGDPTRLTNEENSLRSSLHYTEESHQSDKVCARCAFFEASAGIACGNCKLLKGPVNPKGRCDSWSAAKK
jgi:High potential iron-sulfur protein